MARDAGLMELFDGPPYWESARTAGEAGARVSRDKHQTSQNWRGFCDAKSSLDSTNDLEGTFSRPTRNFQLISESRDLLNVHQRFVIERCRAAQLRNAISRSRYARRSAAVRTAADDGGRRTRLAKRVRSDAPVRVSRDARDITVAAYRWKRGHRWTRVPGRCVGGIRVAGIRE